VESGLIVEFQRVCHVIVGLLDFIERGH